jgi:hypothetical protein
MTTMPQDDRRCTDCGKTVPQEAGDSTLVSMKYGWRLTREPRGEVGLVPTWRCPTCWRAYKQRTKAGGSAG